MILSLIFHAALSGSSTISGPLCAPSVLRVPPCVAGLSSVAHLPLTNTCSRWLHVAARLTRLTRDGHPIQPTHPVFILNDTMLQPATTENLKVGAYFLFSTQRKSYPIHVSHISHPTPTLPTPTLPTTTHPSPTLPTPTALLPTPPTKLT
jgi:hypothetical protein